MVRPIIYNRREGEAASLEFQDNYHFPLQKLKKNLVYNDIKMGKGPSMILLTGSNMSGKSTLMKQICLSIIMGQIGCYVPCSFAKFSIVDKIFTRIGASDRLCLGKALF